MSILYIVGETSVSIFNKFVLFSIKLRDYRVSKFLHSVFIWFFTRNSNYYFWWHVLAADMMMGFQVFAGEFSILPRNITGIINKQSDRNLTLFFFFFFWSLVLPEASFFRQIPALWFTVLSGFNNLDMFAGGAPTGVGVGGVVSSPLLLKKDASFQLWGRTGSAHRERKSGWQDLGAVGE